MSRERTIRNAKIARTALGYEDHGIFTAMLYLEWGGGGQGFGGYGLDQYVKDSDRIGTAAGLTFVMRCCETAGVATWEQLVGKHIRIEHDWSKIHRIGHITDDDKWFDPAAMFEEMRPETEKQRAKVAP